MREPIGTQNAARLSQLAQVKCGWITQVRWSLDGTALAVAGAEGVQLYVGKFGGQPAHVLAGHTGHVKDCAFSPPYRTVAGYRMLLATCAADTTVMLWDVTDLRGDIPEVATLNGHADSVDGVVFSPDRDRPTLVSGCADGTLRVWDIESLGTRNTLAGHSAEVEAACYALNGNVIVSASRDNALRLWDGQGETEGTILGQHQDWVREVRPSPAGTMLASASKDMTVRLWDAYAEEQYGIIRAHEGGADCVAFSPDGALLATGGRDNLVRIWDVQMALRRDVLTPDNALATLDAHSNPVLSLDFNPAGTILASGSGDNSVRLWQVQRGPTVARDIGQTGRLNDTDTFE